MMRLPVFRFHQPGTLPEALELIGTSEGVTRVVAGGTDLWPNMKRRHQSADQVVSLRNVAELRGVRGEAGGEVRIGAMTTLTEVATDYVVRATHPALVRAVDSISTPAIRNMASLGGNLCLDTRCTYYNQNEQWRESIDFCMKEGGTVCWVAPQSPRCWAVSSSDTAPLLCALGARIVMVSSEGEREVPLADLYRDDGMDYMTKRPDEVITEVVIPAPDGLSSSFWKLRRRGSIDFAVLNVGAVIRRNAEGIVDEAQIWLGAVASAPVASDSAAQALVGNPLTPEVIATAAAAARKVATPLDNTDFTLQWRSKMVAVYVEAALREIAGLPAERLSPTYET
jgi:4-hydroxybenzoyl-CoA reductase subunit beta